MGARIYKDSRILALAFSVLSWGLVSSAFAAGGGGGPGPMPPTPAPGPSGEFSPDPSTFYANDYGHVYLFGGGTNALLPGGLLSSSEAWNIDTKLDDGKPDMGAVTTLESQGGSVAGSGCGNQDGDTAAIPASSYDLTNEQKACSLVIKTGY